MTTQALSKPTPRGFWNTAYFLGELRRSWANCLLYGLIYFFGMVVPILNDFSTMRRSDFYQTTTGTMNYESVPFELYVVLAMGIAVWAAIFGMGYLNKRISAYHFHSMPIRREGILLVKTAVAFADFVIALLPNLGLAAVLFVLARANAMPVLLIGLYCLLAFAVAYAFCALMGTLCGTRSFHLILTGIAGFIGPAILYAIYLIADTTTHYLCVDYLIDYRGIIGYTSPFVYIIAQFEQNTLLPIGSVIGLTVFALVCFVGAMAVLRIRPTEGAETPVIFRPVGRVLKYAVMSLSAVFLGYFFQELFYSDTIWMLFGIVSGTVLSFMLMNVLLTRNARRMFSGAIGLLVFAVIFGGSMVGIDAWYSHKDINGYDAASVKSVSVGTSRSGSALFTVSDPAAIQAGVALVDAYFAEIGDAASGTIEESAEVIEIADLKHTVQGLDTRNVYITQTNKLGVSRTWLIRIDLYPELDGLTTEFLRSIADSEEFAEQYVAMFETEHNNLLSLTYTEYVDGGFVEKSWNVPSTDSPAYREIIAELRAQICFDFFQQRQVGRFGTRYGDIWLNLPIYESQTKLIEALDVMEQAEENYEDFLEYGARDLVCIRFDETGKAIDSTAISEKLDDDTLRMIYDSTAIVYGYGTPFFLTRLDREYVIESESRYAAFTFVEGKVPQLIKDFFAAD